MLRSGGRSAGCKISWGVVFRLEGGQKKLPTVALHTLLQTGQLVDAALGRARHEPASQHVPVEVLGVLALTVYSQRAMGGGGRGEGGGRRGAGVVLVVGSCVRRGEL